MPLMDLRQTLKDRLGATSATAAELDALIAGAKATFEDQTGRNLATPATGDPNMTITVPVDGAVAKIRDARVVSLIETSPSRLNPVWTVASIGVDIDSHFNDDTYVFLTFPGDTTAVAARVTGKFGLFGLADPPVSVQEAIVTLAAHNKRSEGSEAAGQWEQPDEGAEMSFYRLPQAYTAVRKLWTVPDPAGLRLPFV